ncbi:MAG TPA: hypothetical protein VFE62_00980 [Gemmataceae bacterium]|nr:hypothetical protein [Gemmataceae bacterium]
MALESSDKPAAAEPVAVRSSWERGLEWLLVGILSLTVIASGIAIIVTGEAKPFVGQGPVALDPVSAWITGLAVIAAGPLLLILFAKAERRFTATRKRTIALLDMLFALFMFVMVGACLLSSFVSSVPQRGAAILAVFAVAASVFASYKLVRIILEYRAGISVPWSYKLGEDSTYRREVEPVAYWWAIGHESLYFMITTVVAGALWSIFWQGLK